MTSPYQYPYAPTAPWPCYWICDVSISSPLVTGYAVQFASSVLWALTGRQFGLTTVTVRPCRYVQRDTPFPDGWLSWPGTQRPPLDANGTGGFYGFWTMAGCGSCDDGGCGCSSLSEVKLAAPVSIVNTVKVDGVTLASSAYRLDENRFLVRVDGTQWPNQNDLNKSDSQVGTWSVNASYGTMPPDGANLAVGELACEVIKAMSGQDCRLPRHVTQLARQGVTISVPDLSTLFEKGQTGLYLADMFINTWNPKHLRSRAKVYSVDSKPARRVGT